MLRSKNGMDDHSHHLFNIILEALARAIGQGKRKKKRHKRQKIRKEKTNQSLFLDKMTVYTKKSY